MNYIWHYGKASCGTLSTALSLRIIGQLSLATKSSKACVSVP